MKEEALKLADELGKNIGGAGNVYQQASAMIRRLVEELDEKNYRILELTKRYKALTWDDKQTKPEDIWTSCLDCGQRVTGDSIHTCSPQTKPLERTDVYGLAIESGFMLSTQHGQAEHKLMPVTDGDTLMVLVKAIEERHGIK